MSGDPNQSRSDRLETGPQSSLLAILPRAEAAAHPQGHGRWSNPHTTNISWLQGQKIVSAHIHVHVYIPTAHVHVNVQ